ncbi:hypothetical protein B0H67DRAFT_591529 [Lasiosphaeris hirsuta]|uniref:Uncharacterized protein n=1 Tax=Lasiosphaeris hirsuta TaxID=260670 RepID=A0AA40DI79_9PEZI|nr:hypothetical protein B0H67DRAFT_591529 [Lasiosphaeris hirsuta]
MALFRAHHYWVAETIVLPFEWIVEVGKMISDVIIVPEVILFYCMARVFPVVECFVSLERLPAFVHDIPEWSKYVPQTF